MSQTGSGQIETRFTIRECTDDTGASADVFHYAFQRIVGADLAAMAVGKRVIGERLTDTLLDQTCQSIYEQSETWFFRCRIAIAKNLGIISLKGTKGEKICSERDSLPYWH